MKTLSLLHAHNREFASRCNIARWFGALFHVAVDAIHIEDAKAEAQAIADRAYKAEQADREALKLLESATADNRIDASEMPSVILAIKHVRNSAENDRKIADEATA